MVEHKALQKRECPRILAAMPGLPDPNFFKAVILLIDHTSRGAFGLIINKPSDMSLAAILEEDGPRLPSDLKVWYGGPVEPNLGIILKKKDPKDPFEMPVELVSSNQALLDLVADHKKNQQLKITNYQQRFIVGSTGWGPGQLDQELREGSWLEIAYNEDLLFKTPTDQIWREAFTSVGIVPDNVIPLHHRFAH